ncbi:MAG TPA: SUMF1/EgtB/PvdO family nonheme iron enzyme, partial [Variovorax sp.]|nr:SUMF1/EgtB/PvdO family nonheme iron enzyme [Variovorax sp.]
MNDHTIRRALTAWGLIAGVLIAPALDVWAQANPQAPAHSETRIHRVGMEFILIPAGSFSMGSPESDAEARAFEKPQHRVRISRSFYLGRFEVTQAQWEAVMGFGPYTLDRSNPYYNLPGMAARITRSDHPATVSWPLP